MEGVDRRPGKVPGQNAVANVQDVGDALLDVDAHESPSRPAARPERPLKP